LLDPDPDVKIAVYFRKQPMWVKKTFWTKNLIFFPCPLWRTFKHPALQRERGAKKFEIKFFPFLWGSHIFFLDPDPDPLAQSKWIFNRDFVRVSVASISKITKNTGKALKHYYFVDFPFLTKRLPQTSFKVCGLGSNLPEKNKNLRQGIQNQKHSATFLWT
jgi:hypothetical protein